MEPDAAQHNPAAHEPAPHSSATSSMDFGAPTHAGNLDPIEMECIRCRARAAMRFYGMCPRCRDELRAKFDVVGRELEVESYTPKVNVTPNAVALKDD